METASRFLVGLSRYRLADFEGADQAFQRYLSTVISLEDKAAGNFWIGKSLAQKGDSEAAQTALQTAAATDPTGYYSERARDLLNERTPFTPPGGYDLTYDIFSERVKAAEWVITKFNLPVEIDLLGPGDLVNDPYLLRGLELWEVGLYDEARGEFEILRMMAQDDPVRTFRLANLFLDLRSLSISNHGCPTGCSILQVLMMRAHSAHLHISTIFVLGHIILTSSYHLPKSTIFTRSSYSLSSGKKAYLRVLYDPLPAPVG